MFLVPQKLSFLTKSYKPHGGYPSQIIFWVLNNEMCQKKLSVLGPYESDFRGLPLDTKF